MSIAKPFIDHELAVLFDVTQAYDEGGLDGYMRRVLSGCEKWFAASGVSLFLRTERGEFELAAKAGSDSRVPDKARFKPGEGIAGACAVAGEPMLVQDPKDNPLLVKVHRRRGIGSAMVVPLITPESGCIGVLNVSRPEGKARFQADDLLQARPLAGHIALAVNNANLIVRLNAAVAESRRSSDRLDAIIAFLGVGLIVIGPAGEVTHWNPAAAGLFHSAVVKGSMLSNLLKQAPKPLARVVRRACKPAIKGKRVVDRAHDETTGKAWSVVCSPLPDHGVTIAIQDVTMHENAQKELSRVKRLAEIGQMTAAIAHEIRNPLTGIRSAAQVVQSLNGEAAEFGRMIEQEALKLNALCDQFLDFARPVVLSYREFRPSGVLEQVVYSYKAEARKAGVRLLFQSDGERDTLSGDPLRFEQICRNLILNGIQASLPGSIVTVRLEQGRLVVQDHGHGIETEVVDKLFTPFFTTRANGTGLGLSNVRKIADAHGWRITVQSKLGKGTRFEVMFGGEEAAA